MDLFNMEIQRNAPLPLGKQIGQLINEHIESPEYAMMYYGEEYYAVRNCKILKKKRYFYDRAGQKYIDEYAPNNRLTSTFNKQMVDQAVGFSLSNAPTIEPLEEDEDAFKANTRNVLKKTFGKFVKEVYKEARKKGKAWCYYFVNEKGEFDYQVFDAREIIPIYDNSFQKKLIQIIRFYPMKSVNGEGKQVVINRVEVYDVNGITFYQQDPKNLDSYEMIPAFSYDDAGNPMGDPTVKANPQPYLTKYITNNPDNKVPYDWGVVPFIKMKCNAEEMPDIQLNKQYIDAYDKASSDLRDSSEEMVDSFYEVTNYDLSYDDKAGKNMGRCFLENLKQRKFVPVTESGGVKVIENKFEADGRLKELDKTRRDVYDFGLGVDTNVDKIGNISGVVLKIQFTNLKTKADDGESEVEDFIREMYEAANTFIEKVVPNITIPQKAKKFKDCGVIDVDNLDIKFNRSEIIDRLDENKAIKELTGIVSKKTQIGMVSGVSDVDAELDQIAEEKKLDVDEFEVEDIDDDDLENEE